MMFRVFIKRNQRERKEKEEEKKETVAMAHEDVPRRWPFISQKESPHQKPIMLVLRWWTFRPQNYKNINMSLLNYPVYDSLFHSPSQLIHLFISKA